MNQALAGSHFRNYRKQIITCVKADKLQTAYMNLHVPISPVLIYCMFRNNNSMYCAVNTYLHCMNIQLLYMKWVFSIIQRNSVRIQKPKHSTLLKCQIYV